MPLSDAGDEQDPERQHVGTSFHVPGELPGELAGELSAGEARRRYFARAAGKAEVGTGPVTEATAGEEALLSLPRHDRRAIQGEGRRRYLSRAAGEAKIGSGSDTEALLYSLPISGGGSFGKARRRRRALLECGRNRSPGVISSDEAGPTFESTRRVCLSDLACPLCRRLFSWRGKKSMRQTKCCMKAYCSECLDTVNKVHGQCYTLGCTGCDSVLGQKQSGRVRREVESHCHPDVERVQEAIGRIQEQDPAFVAENVLVLNHGVPKRFDRRFERKVWRWAWEFSIRSVPGKVDWLYELDLENQNIRAGLPQSGLLLGGDLEVRAFAQKWVDNACEEEEPSLVFAIRTHDVLQRWAQLQKKPEPHGNDFNTLRDSILQARFRTIAAGAMFVGPVRWRVTTSDIWKGKSADEQLDDVFPELTQYAGRLDVLQRDGLASKVFDADVIFVSKIKGQELSSERYSGPVKIQEVLRKLRPVSISNQQRAEVAIKNHLRSLAKVLMPLVTMDITAGSASDNTTASTSVLRPRSWAVKVIRGRGTRQLPAEEEVGISPGYEMEIHAPNAALRVRDIREALIRGVGNVGSAKTWLSNAIFSDGYNQLEDDTVSSIFIFAFAYCPKKLCSILRGGH